MCIAKGTKQTPPTPSRPTKEMASPPHNTTPLANAVQLLPRRRDFRNDLYRLNMLNWFWKKWAGDDAPTSVKAAVESAITLVTARAASSKDESIPHIERELGASEILDHRDRIAGARSAADYAREWTALVHVLHASQNGALREYVLDNDRSRFTKFFPWADATSTDDLNRPTRVWRSVLYYMYVARRRDDERMRAVASTLLEPFSITLWFSVPTYPETAEKGRGAALKTVMNEVQPRAQDLLLVATARALLIRYPADKDSVVLPQDDDLLQLLNEAASRRPEGAQPRMSVAYRELARDWVSFARLRTEDVGAVKEAVGAAADHNMRTYATAADQGVNPVFTEALVPLRLFAGDPSTGSQIAEDIKQNMQAAVLTARRATDRLFELNWEPSRADQSFDFRVSKSYSIELVEDVRSFANDPDVRWRKEPALIERHVRQTSDELGWTGRVRLFSVIGFKRNDELAVGLRALAAEARRTPTIHHFTIAIPIERANGVLIARARGAEPMMVSILDEAWFNLDGIDHVMWDLWSAINAKSRLTVEFAREHAPVVLLWYIEMTATGYSEAEIEALVPLLGRDSMRKYIFEVYHGDRFGNG